MVFELKNEEGKSITRLDDWPRPKKEEQWKPCRSAMEFARYWTETHVCGTVPPDYLELLNTGFPGIEFHLGQPEFSTCLPPKGSSNPRLHDLHLWGTSPSGSITVCVEAKADERFGDTIGKEWVDAKLTHLCNPRSQKKQRLEDLIECIWGIRKPADLLPELRYQLLHALVGTAIQALRDLEKTQAPACGTGVLLVHVFETKLTEKYKLEQNQQDLDRFANALPKLTVPAAGILPGILFGPANVSVPADFAPSAKTTLAKVYLAKLLTVIH